MTCWAITYPNPAFSNRRGSSSVEQIQFFGTLYSLAYRQRQYVQRQPSESGSGQVHLLASRSSKISEYENQLSIK